MKVLHRALVICGFMALTLSMSVQRVAAQEDEQEDSGSGLEGGVRFGYGAPFGKVTDAAVDDLSEGISGQFPISLDLGYRAGRSLFIGVYGHYGFGMVGDTISAACSSVDCSTSDLRLGPQLHYHFLAKGPFDPWLGVGFGYEWMIISMSGGGGEVAITTSGFEFINLQFGADHHVSDHVYLGGFFTFALGQYDDVSADCSGGATCGPLTNDGSITSKSLHGWLMLGIRGGYTP